MLRLTIAFFTIGMIASASVAQERAAQGGKDRGDAVQAKLEKFGGAARRDEKRAGKPVVAVDLRGPRATDEVIDIVSSQPDLEAIALVSTRITDDGLRGLKANEKLQSLDLIGRDVTDDTLAPLADLTSLKVLVLNAPRVTDDG